ncbi:MAG: hypothetical protein IJ730_04935 [Alphaproteobacteria bacterium]|nr:hypothetical protein [Alphaproteobacteria bacterium]
MKYEELAIIRGIKFAPKEIDIISCILGGKSQQSIAALLRLSPRTVGTYLNNIKFKINCHSKEQIINFIEQSDKYDSVLQHYEDLVNSRKDNNGLLANLGKCIYRNMYFNKFLKYLSMIGIRVKILLRDLKILISLCFLIILSLIIYNYKSNKTQEISLYTQFVGEDILLQREELIKKIDKSFNNQRGIKYVVLIGEGGRGKTVLARHYLQVTDCKIKAEINAESIENILNSFNELSLALTDTKELQKDLSYIKTIRDKNLQIKQAVHFVFSQLDKKGSWCLLFDNVDDFNTIRDFIPPKDSIYNEGKIIIITRNGNFKNMGIFSKNAIIYVPLLTESEGEELFSNIICTDKKTEPGNILKDFWRHIPLMPLDICAAAYYMKNTNISYKDYLNVINKPNVDFEKLQLTFLKEGINYDNSRYAILASIFEKIIKVDTSFKKLLLLICLLDSQNIPISYLERSTDHVTAQKFLYELRRFSLITEKGSTFSLHRSTQDIGLRYIFSILSREEKNQFLENVLRIMTPYERIMPSIYGMQLNTMDYNEVSGFLPHVKACLNKVKQVRDLENKKKYIIKLSLSIFHLYARKEQGSSEFSFYEQFINANKHYISNYDLAVSLLVSVYISFVSDIFSIEIIKPKLEEVLILCDHLDDCTNLRGLAYVFLGRLYFENGNSEKGMYYLEKLKQLQITNKIIVGLICNQYAQAYLSNYVLKPDLKEGISYVLEILRFLAADKFFYRSSSNNTGKDIHFAQALRWRLARMYNVLELYDTALENEKEAEFLYSNLKYPIKRIALLRLSQSYTYLRLNKLKEAQKMLNDALKIKQKILDYYEIYLAFTMSAEINIRLKNFDEAKKNSKEALKFLEHTESNLKKLTKVVCYYNLAIIEHAKHNNNASVEYFKRFFELVDEFCKTFLDKNVYLDLDNRKVFKCSDDIQNCLQNSYRIFVAICGADHSFIRNYVAKNH